VGRKPIYSPEDKMQVVLSVLRGETTQSDIARRLQMSQTTIAKWQKQFLQGGIEALSRGENARPPSSKREEELEMQVDELTTALGEAYVELRVWRKGGSLPPYEEIEAIRAEAGVPVSRLLARLGSRTRLGTTGGRVSCRARRRDAGLHRSSTRSRRSQASMRTSGQHGATGRSAR